MQAAWVHDWPFLARDCGERGGGGCQGHAAMRSTTVEPWTATTPRTTAASMRKGQPRGSRQMTGGRPTVGLVNAAEHWQAWLRRYGGHLATHEERPAPYRDLKAHRATPTQAFPADHA